MCERSPAPSPENWFDPPHPPPQAGFDDQIGHRQQPKGYRQCTQYAKQRLTREKPTSGGVCGTSDY